MMSLKHDKDTCLSMWGCLIFILPMGWYRVFYNSYDSRVLTRILKIGVKMLFARKNGVLPYFSIGTFEKVGVRIKKLE